MSLKIDKKDDTPFINLQEGLIEIKGRSLPENVIIFYAPVMKWIRDYCEKPAKHTIINISLSYTNSSSLKTIVEILYLLNLSYLEGNKMELNWFYEQEDDSIYEIAQDLEANLEIPIQCIEKEVIVSVKNKILVRNIKTGKVGEITQLYWDSIKRNGYARNFELVEK
ncbi:MAG: DUF1987 domain-containing protein [Bacteroidota bacterium]|nr:DUF1987 domain-containing protein [Bacteroidota bacterium]